MPRKTTKKPKQMKQKQKQRQSVVVNITNPTKRVYSRGGGVSKPKPTPQPPSTPHIPHLIVERPTVKFQQQDATKANTLVPQQVQQPDQVQRLFTEPRRVPIQPIGVNPLIPIATQVNKLEMMHELKGKMKEGEINLKTPDLRRRSTTGGMSTGMFASSPMMSALNQRREAVAPDNDENNDEWNDTGGYSITPLEEFKQPDAPYVNNLTDIRPPRQQSQSQPAGNQDKPYTCLVCNKSYTRRDALTRHYNTSPEHQRNLARAQQAEEED